MFYVKININSWSTSSGKMTVGQELEKIIKLKFMHNHETLDLLAKILGWDSETRHRLTNLFRFSIFEEVVKIEKN